MLASRNSRAQETVPASWRTGACYTTERVHSDCLDVGDSGPAGNNELLEDGGLRYILVMIDDLRDFVWL